MIDFYTWSTPNGRKVSLMLEECGLDYKVIEINIGKDQQFAPEFLAISPNNKIPAIVDHNASGGGTQSVFETGAILIYLAEKTGKFIPQDAKGRIATLEWLMWQMGGLGPMAGQAHHFLRFNKGKAPYAEERYGKETQRLYGIMNTRLANNKFLAGDEYTIADMSAWPWVSRFEWQEIDMNAFTHVRRWYETIASRPAVMRGYDVPKRDLSIPMPT